MAEGIEGGAKPKKKVKFQPIKLQRAKNPMVQENLMNLEMNAHKKKMAQAYYYGNDNGQSPLTRSIATLKERTRQPVHQRLGNKKITLRRMPPPNVNNNGMAFRNKKLQLRRNDMGASDMPNFRRNNYNKASSVQLRLHQIRMQNNFDNSLQMPQSPAQRIKLRRRRLNVLRNQPTNFTVQVNNAANYRNQNHLPNYIRHSVRSSLNSRLQSEIEMIQSHSQHSPVVIQDLPIHVPGFGTTAVFLHQRFSLL